MKIKELEFAEVNFELDDCDEVYASISKEDVKNIFESKGYLTYNDEGDQDDSYISGEIQFIFRKNTEEIIEVLLFPCYEYEDCINNGDFIDITNEFAKYEDEAIEFLRKKK